MMVLAGLTRAPDYLMEALRAGIRDGLANGDARLEHSKKVDAIGGPTSLFIDWPDLMKWAITELHPYGRLRNGPVSN